MSCKLIMLQACLTSQHDHPRVMQARDDSIAGFQMLQQQGPSPGQKERLAQLARQLEDAQAQLFTSQVSCTQVTSVLPHLCMQIVH